MHSILAGSVRANSRLAKSHGLKPQCRCGAEHEDVAHVFRDCPDHQHIRTTYQELLSNEARHDIETKDAAKTLPDNEIFQLCGIVPESSQLIQWQDHTQEDEGDAAEVPQLSELPEASRHDELWHGEWLRIFTGGGVSDPDDCRLSLGGCGVFF